MLLQPTQNASTTHILLTRYCWNPSTQAFSVDDLLPIQHDGLVVELVLKSGKSLPHIMQSARDVEVFCHTLDQVWFISPSTFWPRKERRLPHLTPV